MRTAPGTTRRELRRLAVDGEVAVPAIREDGADGTAVSGQGFPSRAEALAAVGLSE